MTVIYFITGNQKKFTEFLQTVPKNCPFQFRQLNLDLQEIQNIDGKKVLEEKIKAANKIYPEYNLFVEDTELSITKLNGFPGAYIKDFYSTLGPHKIVEIANNSECFVSSNIGLYLNGQFNVYTGTQKCIITNKYLEKAEAASLKDFDCILRDITSENVFYENQTSKIFRKKAFQSMFDSINTNII